jgi:hypothetical protein
MKDFLDGLMCGALLTLLVSVFIFSLLGLIPMSAQISDLQNQAIKRGYAEYRLPDGADPNTMITSTIDHCREVVGSQLTPKRIFIVNELPRSDAGKLYRSRLVQQFNGV